ncbi:MAG TPA: aldo/keto reductase [Caulobacteraceae bacterium]|jgi:2,5-diketo-D-gluconate reductase A
MPDATLDRDIQLNDGRAMPRLGLGVWQAPPDQTAGAVQAALDAGYRAVDTAAAYRNERGVGDGVRSSGLARKDVFITTKLWNDSHGFEATLRAFEASLARLGGDYIDLYLIHWPAPRQNQFVESWRAMIRLREEGRARSIGVSNFNAAQIDRLIAETGVAPALNQVELHPAFQQGALRAATAKSVVTESWSPLGRGNLLSDATLVKIGAKHGKTAAQVIIRWHLQQGLIVIPKSVTPARIRENFDVWDFALDEADLAAIAALDSPSGRMGPDPASFG